MLMVLHGNDGVHGNDGDCCVYAHRHCPAGPLTSCLPMKSRNKKRELTFIDIR